MLVIYIYCTSYMCLNACMPQKLFYTQVIPSYQYISKEGCQVYVWFDLISKSLTLFLFCMFCNVLNVYCKLYWVFWEVFLVVIFNFNTFLFQFYIYINDFLNINFIVSSQDLVWIDTLVCSCCSCTQHLKENHNCIFVRSPE